MSNGGQLRRLLLVSTYVDRCLTPKEEGRVQRYLKNTRDLSGIPRRQHRRTKNNREVVIDHHIDALLEGRVPFI